jgi:allantoinase
VAKCAPPLRPQTEQAALWQQLLDGSLPMVASDHSPAPASMKTGTNFFQVWGGISGCQSMLRLLLTEGYARRKLPLTTIASVTAEYVARRFGLAPDKGRIAAGADADLALVDLQHSSVLQADDLLYRHRHSPYVGRTLRGRVVRTLVRGTTVFQDGQIVSAPIGRLLTPRPIGR